MNPWVIVYLPGSVGVDALVVGSYSSRTAAMAAAINTASPFNWQVGQVWGNATFPQLNPIALIDVPTGSWIAICPGVSEYGTLMLFGYGTFSKKADALAWASKQDNPEVYAFGQVSSVV